MAAVGRDADGFQPACLGQTRHMRHLALTALLDLDLAQAVLDGEIDGGRGCRDEKRHVIVKSRQRLEIGADLVADIAARGGAVGAYDHEVDHAMLHEMAADIVHHDRVRHAMVTKFPGGERGSLVARACLVDIDVNPDARVMRLVDRRGRRAPIDSCQPARIAMGENVDRRATLARGDLADQREPVVADGRTDRDILFRQLAGQSPGLLRPLGCGQRREGQAQPLQRPAQVDGGGARRCKLFDGVGESRVGGVGHQGKGQSISPRHADQRRPAHLHVGDGAGGRPCIAQHDPLERMRQQRLVDDLDSAEFNRPDRPERGACDLHGDLLFSRVYIAPVMLN